MNVVIRDDEIISLYELHLLRSIAPDNKAKGSFTVPHYLNNQIILTETVYIEFGQHTR